MSTVAQKKDIVLQVDSTWERVRGEDIYYGGKVVVVVVVSISFGKNVFG